MNDCMNRATPRQSTSPLLGTWFAVGRGMVILLLALLASPVHARDDRGRARPVRSHQPAMARPAQTAKPASRHKAARVHPEVKHKPSHVAAHVSFRHSRDHRFARPYPWRVHALPGHPLPRLHSYWGWHSHWWVHPWYRWMHATVAVVRWDWVGEPWVPAWVPPVRNGWLWVSGHSAGDTWVPGHWAPVASGPAGYVYVPGFWAGNSYVGGHWRLVERVGWRWVAARTDHDHHTVQGHWEPTGPLRPEWSWEPGFWDGEVWVEGYWRPNALAGYDWVSAHWDEEGVYHCGYWEPTEDKPGHVWVPGWFNGQSWVPGYWVTAAEVDAADPENWSPPEGWDNGDASGTTTPESTRTSEGPAIALPAE